MNKTIEGIVLANKDYRDNDGILHVLCKDEGIQSLVAKGIRKLSSKNAGACQPFTCAKFYIDYHEGKQMHTMRTADVINTYRGIREDLVKQSMASVICECMEKANMEDGFAFLQATLQSLLQTKQPYGLLALFFSCMNSYMGIEPYVDGCVHCGHDKGICAISIIQGGFVCQNCMDRENDRRYGKEVLKCFRLLCKAQMAQFPILEAYQNWDYEHFYMVYQFFEEYSGIRLQSMKFLTCLQDLKGRKIS